MGPFSGDPDGEDDSFSSSSGSDRKTRKPLVEKRRRARINESLQELRMLLPDTELSSKMENAEVLEMTVKRVEQILQNRSEEAPVEGEGERFAAGYIQCMHEVHTFVSAPSGLHATTATHLLSHLLECMPLHSQQHTHTHDSSSQHTHSDTQHTHDDTQVDESITEHAEEEQNDKKTQELEDSHSHTPGQDTQSHSYTTGHDTQSQSHTPGHDTQSHTLQEDLLQTPLEQETHLSTPGNKPHPWYTAAHSCTPEQQAQLSSPVPPLHTAPTQTHLSSPENRPRPSTPGQVAHWSATPEPQTSYTVPMETQLSIPGNKPYPFTPGQGAHLSTPEPQTSYTALKEPQPYTLGLQRLLSSSPENKPRGAHLSIPEPQTSYTALTKPNLMETQVSTPGNTPHPYTPGQGAHLSIPELRGPLSSSSPVPQLYSAPLQQDILPGQQVLQHTPENGSHLYTAGPPAYIHTPTQTHRQTHTPDVGGCSHLYNAGAHYPHTPQPSTLHPQPHSAPPAAPMTTVSRQLYYPQEQVQEVDMMEEAGPQPGQSATVPHATWRPW